MSPPRKIYVHYERENQEGITLACAVDAETTVRALLQAFLARLSAQLGVTASPEQCTLRTEDGETLKSHSHTTLVQELLEEDQRDLFVFLRETAPLAANANATAADASLSAKPTAVAAAAAPLPRPPPPAAAKSAVELRREEVARNVAQAKALEELMRRRLFKRARELVQGLATNSNNSNSSSSSALYSCRCAMEIDLYCRRHDKVIEAAQRLRAPPAASSLSMASNAYFLDIVAMEGIALMRTQKYAQAARCFESVGAAWRERALRAKQQPRYVQSEDFLLHIVALHAECVFSLGQHSEAANLLNGIMHMEQADTHLAVLCAYATFTLRFHKFLDAINAVLKAVAIVGTQPARYALSSAQRGETTQDQEQASYLRDGPQRVKEVVTELLSTREGLEHMLKTFPPHSRGTAEVYAYLASTVKDLSATDLCLRLYDLALQAHPNHANLTLNAVHAHEIKLDYEAGLEQLQVFFAKNLKLSLGRESGAPYTLSCAQVVDAMKRESPRASRSATSSSTSRFQTHRVLWMDRNDRQYAVFSCLEGGETNRNALESVGAISGSDFSVTFTERELDLLALFATTVKLLFLSGSLSKLPSLVQSIEALRRLSKAQLHLTNIRNELAYYTHIVQILFHRNHSGFFGLPLHINAFADPLLCEEEYFVDARQRPIFVCGDSHCLSSAWSTVNVKGKNRLIYPRLVTGIKQFHLRDESRFYPKENFMQAVASIPAQSEVIFVIGEIDCREGILAAVERDVYETIEEGMRVTIGYFTKVLVHLKTRKQFKMYIHPVPPVLKETRLIVTVFNRLYKEAVENLQDENITWLDFADDLLDVNGTSIDLKDCYRHDGTHLSPKYVELIEKCLNQT